MDLRSCDYFSSLDDATLERLQERGREIEFPAGLLLTEPGQIGSGLYVIIEGTAVVEPPEGPKEIGPGEVFGELAMLAPDGRRTARVRATTAMRCLAIDRPTLEREGLTA
jgi:voltage-gated potassium channel